jgi:putative flippase GtrA
MHVLNKGVLQNQLVRYIINGLVATAIHFCVLKWNLEVLGIHSAGVANALAAVFGIAASFLGSRYFVFPSSQGKLLRQGFMFVLLYACIAMLHGLVLYLWTDRAGWDYRIGFLVATIMQISFSFFANKFLVFK